MAKLGFQNETICVNETRNNYKAVQKIYFKNCINQTTLI